MGLNPTGNPKIRLTDPVPRNEHLGDVLWHTEKKGLAVEERNNVITIK